MPSFFFVFSENLISEFVLIIMILRPKSLMELDKSLRELLPEKKKGNRLNRKAPERWNVHACKAAPRRLSEARRGGSLHSREVVASRLLG